MRIDVTLPQALPPLRVVHIISGDLWAGAESQVFQTLRALLAYHPEVDIRCLLFNDGILAGRLRSAGLSVTVIDEARFNVAVMLLRITILFKIWQPHILHVHHIKEHFLALACKMTACLRGVPIVRTLHGLSKVPGHLRGHQRLRSSAVVGIDQWLVKYATDIIIAVSQDLYRQTLAKRIRGDIRQIYNAIDVSPYAIAMDRTRLRLEFGTQERLWIVTATRLVEPKNLEMLIYTGAVLREKGIDAFISVFGQGPLESALKRRIRELGLEDQVHLHGFTDRLNEILSTADVFVLCSRHEGLPMALIEAMAAGAPVVCTAVGGMREVVNDEENGLLVRLNDVPAMASAIQRLWADKALTERLAKNAKATIRQRFESRENSTALFRLYREVQDAYSLLK